MKKIGIVLGCIILLIAGILFVYSNKVLSENVIHSNIYIEDVYVGDLTPDDATKILEEKYNQGNITFTHQGNHWRYNLEELGYRYDIEKAVQEAYNIGRNKDIFSNVLRIFLSDRGYKETIPMDRKENFEAFYAVFDELEKSVNVDPVDAQILIESTIAVINGKKGIKVDRELLSEQVKQYLKNSDGQSISIPVKEENEKITASYLRQINGVIGEYHTTFNNRIPGRNHNIRLAASRIDHVLLNPGEVFSFNEKNGEISVASGYVDAPVIVKGELQEGIGGGVCQVSSTLYNSVLLSDLKIVERRNHSIPSGYVPIGRDATIFGNIIDFKFMNDKDYPIYIRSYVQGNTVKVLIYGDTGKHPKVSLTSTIVEVIPKKIQKIDDPSLPTGKEEIKTPGRDGIKSVTSIVINGVSKVISKDHYPMAVEVVRVGTGTSIEEPLLEGNSPNPGTFIPELNVFEPMNP